MPNPYPFQVRLICFTCGDHISSDNKWTPDGCLVTYRHADEREGARAPVYDHQAAPTPVPPEDW